MHRIRRPHVAIDDVHRRFDRRTCRITRTLGTRARFRHRLADIARQSTQPVEFGQGTPAVVAPAYALSNASWRPCERPLLASWQPLHFSSWPGANRNPVVMPLRNAMPVLVEHAYHQCRIGRHLHDHRAVGLDHAVADDLLHAECRRNAKRRVVDIKQVFVRLGHSFFDAQESRRAIGSRRLHGIGGERTGRPPPASRRRNRKHCEC